MTLIVLLFLVGIVLIAAEVIVPGAILGTLGGLAMAGASVLAFLQFGSGGGFIALATALTIAAIALYLEFRVLPKTKIGTGHRKSPKERARDRKKKGKRKK